MLKKKVNLRTYGKRTVKGINGWKINCELNMREFFLAFSEVTMWFYFFPIALWDSKQNHRACICECEVGEGLNLPVPVLLIIGT